MGSGNDLWSTHELQDGEGLRWHGGPLSLYIQRDGNDWIVATEYNRLDMDQSARVEPIDSIPFKLSPSRWAFGVERPVIRFCPCPPSRPVLVRTRTPLNIPAGVDLRFYVSTPVSVRMEVAPSRDAADGDWLKIDPIATVVMSDTWYGDQIAGEFCYSLKTRARRDIEELEPKPYRVVSPLLLRNMSGGSIVCDKLCLRLAHVDFYRDGDAIWSSEIDVKHLGKDKKDIITYASVPPKHLESPVKVAAGKPQAQETFTQRALSFTR